MPRRQTWKDKSHPHQKLRWVLEHGDPYILTAVDVTIDAWFDWVCKSAGQPGWFKSPRRGKVVRLKKVTNGKTR